MMRCALAVTVAVAVVFLASCKKEEITTYKIPKEQAPASTMPKDHNHANVAQGAGSPPAGGPMSGGAASGSNAMANTPVATASGSGLTWKGPSHWQEKPASGMRKGTFTIAGDGGATAELAITAFPGDVGGEAANVNRWRGQLSLPPLAPDEAVRSIERIDANGLKIGVVEMAASGGTARRVLAAMVSHAGSMWFFKLDGPDALVTKEKAAFREFREVEAGGRLL
jgi:hypothetical protein